MLISIADKTNTVVQFLTVLLIFALVLVVTFWVTKWLGNYQKQQNTGSNIEVIESTRIAPNVFAQIVRLGNRYVAIAVSKENVTLLCELSEDELKDALDKNTGIADFGSIFNKVKAGIPSKKDEVLENDSKNE